MKKRTAVRMITILIFALLLLLAGCASKEPPASSASPSPSEASPSAKPTVSQSADPSPTPSLIVDPPPPSSEPSAVPSAKPSPSPKDNSGKDYAALGWALMESESLGSITLRMSESALITLMGEPDSKSETEVWGADGLEHSSWSYASKGLEIGMAKQPDDTEAFIFSLTAMDPCDLATSRGIKLGDSKDAVLSAYKNEIDPSANDDTDSWIIVGSVYGGMGIGIENGAVTYIFIGAAAE